MKKVLVIDDEADIRSVLKFRLEKAGYHCLTAADGKEGLAVVAAEKPDFIILDLIMPVMDGVKVYRHLKMNPKTKHIPILAFTAQDADTVVAKGQPALDIVDLVLKPFDAEALVKTVQRVLAVK